jgi:DNA-binding MarR family transcriptional regulator
MQSNRVKELSPLELAAWRGLLRIHAALVDELDRELEATHALPLTHYEVLLYLDVAPNRQLRMSELASSILLSQSGLTRLVDRLERAGLVVREPCPDDRRGLLASITAAGRERLAEARPTHLAGIRELFLSHLDESELEGLASAWEHVRPGITA